MAAQREEKLPLPSLNPSARMCRVSAPRAPSLSTSGFLQRVEVTLLAGDLGCELDNQQRKQDRRGDVRAG